MALYIILHNSHSLTSHIIITLTPHILHPSEAGGKYLQEGMEDNKTLVTFDLRLTDISQESEYVINKRVKENLGTYNKPA